LNVLPPLVGTRHALIAKLLAEGVGLLALCQIDVGTKVQHQLLSDSVPMPVERYARVVHAAPYEKQSWFIGCAFASPLSTEEIIALSV
jgi:hypothetical protein